MTTDKIKITMSERRPLSISPEEWPLIARADRHDGKVESQANHRWSIRVRQHADGRRLVYGYLREGNGGVPAGWRGADGGFLVAAGDEDGTVRAIRRIAGIIDDDKMADECIADLPEETLDEPGPPAIITMPRAGALRLLRLLDCVATSGPTGIDPQYATELRAVADELADIVGGR
jgi:hypothetical protein